MPGRACGESVVATFASGTSFGSAIEPSAIATATADASSRSRRLASYSTSTA